MTYLEHHLNGLYACRDADLSIGETETAAEFQRQIDALLAHRFTVEPVSRRVARRRVTMHRVSCPCSDGWHRVVGDESQAERLGLLHAKYSAEAVAA